MSCEVAAARGGFSVLVRGVADSERSEPKIFATPLSIFATPLQGGGKFYRGVATINPQTYKQRADIWLSYCYIHFNFHLKEQLSNRFSLNCLWYDLIPGPYLSCLCIRATSVYTMTIWNMNRNLNTSINNGVKNHT